MIRKLHKRYVLPIKWWFTKMRRESSLKVKQKIDFLEMEKEYHKQLLKYRRLRNIKEAAKAEGKLELIKELMYDPRKDNQPQDS